LYSKKEEDGDIYDDLLNSINTASDEVHEHLDWVLGSDTTAEEKFKQLKLDEKNESCGSTKFDAAIRLW